MAYDESKEGLLSHDAHQDDPGNTKESSKNNAREHRSLDSKRSSSSSDLDATEFLDRDPLTSTKPGSSSSSSSSSSSTSARPRWLSPRGTLGGRLRFCAAFTGLLLGLWLVFGGGGTVVYSKIRQEPAYGLSPPWYPSPKGGTSAAWADSYAKAAEMVARMTLAEKVNVTTGTGWQMGLAVGQTGPANQAGFPALYLQDGPLGIRFADGATAWPAGVTVGATWNKRLMYERGKAHAIEARQKGVNVILGPCVGPLGRMPAGGRNWEGFGPDPYLQGVAGAETVRGIQSEGVMATIKHFVANEQEHYRQAWEWGLPHALSANIDDRALHELYAWPFADAIRAGVASVMCSYEMVNNSYACGNSKLLNGVLKDEFGFQGFVMSDWLAQRSGVASALAGLDMTMPGDGLRWADGDSLFGSHLSKAVLNGSLPVDRLDDMATRVVAAWYQLGQDDEARWPREPPNFSSWSDEKMGVMAPGSPSPQDVVEVNRFVNVQSDHSTLARQVAAEGIVLLKNEGVLPMSRDGHTASSSNNSNNNNNNNNNKKPQKQGGAAGKIKIGIFGEDAAPIPEGPNRCRDRSCNEGTLGSGWGSGAVEFPYLVSPVEALRAQFDASEVELHEFLTNNPPSTGDDAVFEDLTTCFVFANADSGEGFSKWDGEAGDRSNIQLQKGGDVLITKVASRCGFGRGDVVVVIHSVGPVLLENWIDLPNVRAVLYANLPGQESGNALADVVFGDVNPSGHLPYTIGRSLDDYGRGAKVMYVPNGVVPQQDFAEGLYVDYRHFDKRAIAPRFEFGFGLSYTTFGFAACRVAPLGAKTALPAARPAPGAVPPSYPTTIPSAEEVLFPLGFRPLEKYVYPYLSSADGIAPGPYPLPDGYDTVQPLSGAGGGEGGNPDLWETYARVQVDVTNTGAVAGAAVAQLYIAYPDEAEAEASGRPVDFPVKVLRGFEKVELAPGETRTVEFNVTRRDLSYWDVEAQNWRLVVEGKYTFLVGQSSRDLPVSAQW